MTLISLVPAVSDATITGTITAAQPSINTPVTNASVTLATGTGQSSWKATLTGAGFTSGSTIVVDHSSDNGTTWFPSSFKVVGSLQTTTVQSVVGPAPIEISGDDAATSHIKVRCSVLHAGDSITASIRSGYGIASVGLMSSLPAGNNLMGGVNLAQINGTTAVVPTLGQNTSANSLSVIQANDQAGISDGLTSLPASVPFLLSSGGPTGGTGITQGMYLDRIKSWQGSAVAGAAANITATVAGDTSLVFGSAPKTITPGAKIQLGTGSNPIVETVLVSNSYVPSPSQTTIPLAYPVVTAGSTVAKWDIYAVMGPIAAQMLPNDLLPVVNVGIDPSTFFPYALITSVSDGRVGNNILAQCGYAVNSAGTHDKLRGNLDNITLIASASNGTTQTSADQTNYNGRGVIVVLDMTVASASPSVTLEIDGKDPVSGKYFSLLTGAAVTTVSTNVYTVYPGAPATANVSANSPLPRTWRVKVTANNANVGTYSAGAMVIL